MENKNKRKQLINIFYIFILLRIKTFISSNKQAETAFYAKEEGLRKVKEEQSKQLDEKIPEQTKTCLRKEKEGLKPTK